MCGRRKTGAIAPASLGLPDIHTELMGIIMCTLSELRGFHQTMKDDRQVAFDALQRSILAKAPDVPEQKRAIEALLYAFEVLDDELFSPLATEILNREGDEPGEDPRREHGTYTTSNGMRAA